MNALSVGVAVSLIAVGCAHAELQESQAKPTPGTMTYQGREIPRTEAAILHPSHTVLVIHEVLNDFVSKGGAADKAGARFAMDAEIARIAELLAAARANKVRVAHVRWTRFEDGATDDDAACARRSLVCSGRRTEAGRAHPPMNIEGTWGWEGPEALAPAPGEWVLPKWRQDAFFSTQLDALMRWNDIKTMVIVGMGVEHGIVPTVMTASELGYFPVVVEDAVAAAYPKRMEGAMEFLRDTAIIKNSETMQSIWSDAVPTPTLPQIQNTDAEILDPEHTVLLIQDMLEDFVGKEGAFDKADRRIDADAILQPVAKLVAEARAKNVPVAYVRWTNYADDSTFAGPMRRSLRADLPDVSTWAVEDTPGWAIIDAVKPLPGDWMIRKHRQDAFFATPLDSLLRWNGTKTVVVVGVGAEKGVLSTLMSASNRGYNTVAVSDGLSTTDPSRMKDAMRFIADQAQVKTHLEILNAWGAASPRPEE